MRDRSEGTRKSKIQEKQKPCCRASLQGAHRRPGRNGSQEKEPGLPGKQVELLEILCQHA